MVFNDGTNSLGICQEVDDICGTSTSSYPLAAKARRANSALSDFVSIALDSDDRWNFEDTNHSELPIGTTALVNGQNDYELDNSMLKILKVELKSENDTWVELIPIDRNDTEIPYEQLFGEGTPKYYDKFANSALLFPTPNYDQDDSLRVWYQRDASYFTATDTDKAPGIPSLFHKYIALKIAEPYARDKQLKNYVSIRNEIQKYEEETIPAYYAKRNKDERPGFTGKVIDCR
jgi:hypothetical protein